MRLDHVALTVRDRERSAAFYREHFGMSRRVHDDDHLLILAGEGDALLALSAGEPPEGVERLHFGFRASSAEEVRGARRRFVEAGVTESEWQDDDIVVRVQVVDPDGYRVELYVF